MKVLSISSQVVWGPVGNSAAVPALQKKMIRMALARADAGSKQTEVQTSGT